MRFLDQPLADCLVRCDHLQVLLKELATHPALPQRHRSQFARLFVQVKRLAREMEHSPDTLLEERDQERRRGPA